MKKNLLIIFAIAVLAGCVGNAHAKSCLKNFINREADKLMDGDKEFRFISCNVTNLHFNEDSKDFTGRTKFRMPDEFEMRDALESVKQMGMGAIRIHPLSVRNPNEACFIPKHILGVGKYDEESMKTFDKLFQLANEIGVRIIVPLVDHHDFLGGVPSYLAFRGDIIEDFLSAPDRKMESFYSDKRIIDDFKKNVAMLLNRTNTYTGVKYKDDKAVLCWETGNELRGATAKWTHEICKFIKSIDSNHLTMDGYFSKVAREESAADPYVDILTIHLYPDAYVQIESNFAVCKGKKPLIIGEFGFMPTNSARDILDYVIDSGVNGACLWSLRYHRREGGFYFHLEGWSPDSRFKSYHWPGFASGDSYDESNMLALMREMSYKIQGMDMPKRRRPKATKMLDIDSVGSISWQGSAGASGYDIERSENKLCWERIGENVSDARYQYRPLFSDETAEIGKSYYYRVIARNEAGKSSPSNVVGPVKVEMQRLVDECCDFSKIFAYEKRMVIDGSDVDKTREDMYRLKCPAGKRLIYKTDGAIRGFKLYAFYPGEVKDVKVSLSCDNKNYEHLSLNKSMYYFEKSHYKPVLFEGKSNGNANYLKIEFTGQTQLSAVEIDWQ